MTIHMDPIDYNDEKTNVCRDMMAGILKEIDEGLTMHDFRIVSGPTHTNLIFDLEVPFEVRMSDTDLRENLFRLVRSRDPSLYTVVTIDRE